MESPGRRASNDYIRNLDSAPSPGWDRVEESLAAVEVIRQADGYVAKVQSELGGVREYRGMTFEAVLEQVIIDLQEEFEVPELGP